MIRWRITVGPSDFPIGCSYTPLPNATGLKLCSKRLPLAGTLPTALHEWQLCPHCPFPFLKWHSLSSNQKSYSLACSCHTCPWNATHARVNTCSQHCISQQVQFPLTFVKHRVQHAPKSQHSENIWPLSLLMKFLSQGANMIGICPRKVISFRYEDNTQQWIHF